MAVGYSCFFKKLACICQHRYCPKYYCMKERTHMEKHDHQGCAIIKVKNIIYPKWGILVNLFAV